jgi:prolyl oligopeptidase
MPRLISAPPVSPSEPVTEMLHGVWVTDPYRWLEDQNSPRTRHWIDEQTRYAREYLDRIPGRDGIRKRIREFLEIETYESVEKAGDRYFFRKRLATEEQPSLYMRQGPQGQDQLLVDPAMFGTGTHTAVKIIRVSPSGKLLLYETKQGGERTGTFVLFDVESRRTLQDALPRGFLRGFIFAPDEKSFYYIHEPLDSKNKFHRVVRHHVLGTKFENDEETFFAGERETIRVCLVSDLEHMGILVYRLLDKLRTDFYLKRFENGAAPAIVLAGANYLFAPHLLPGKILALTDLKAPNLRLVELRVAQNGEPRWINLVPERDARIREWRVAGDRVYVSYARPASSLILIFDMEGREVGELAIPAGETIRFVGGFADSDELLFERESFTKPVSIFRHSPESGAFVLWARKNVPFDSRKYRHTQLSYTSKDGTEIPMFLMGKRDVLAGGNHPVIMTSYGGYAVSMTPQFSVFVAYLVERGCLFALPNIRGGSEFGTDWHTQAKRRRRQTAYDDFLSAADWLIRSGRTTPEKLAIFGGSNSGLLVGAAMTQHPELFRAVVSMVPMLDMLRYHLFDGASAWREEFGTADDPEDFNALVAYSPYHRVERGTAYPATMIVSGDADGTCNPLHARKMTARLQEASSSGLPIFLDYSPFRGHSPVLPLSDRVQALTDRMAFLVDQLQLQA